MSTREEAIETLRALLMALEADTDLPAPTTVTWSIDTASRLPEIERFNQLHDVADAFGLEVVEDVHGTRKLRGKYGALTLSGYAWANYREETAPPVPRPVSRPTPDEVAQAHDDSARHTAHVTAEAAA
jgi:hypothetical protein